MNTKGFINIILVIIIIVVVGGVVGYFVLVRKTEDSSLTQTPPPADEESDKTTPETFPPADEFEDLLMYEWDIIKFKYPSDWKVEKNYYRTPAQEEAGEPASVIGLTLFPKDKPANNNSILFGGRQFDCQNFLGNIPRCLTLFSTIPIYTFSENFEILEVFDSLIKTVTYNNPDAAFQILFPSAENQLEVNKRYTIQWKTKSDLQVQKVNLIAFDTSLYWQEGLTLSVENIPNTGSYEWTVPTTVKSPGPYLISISYCEPIEPPPTGTISSCKLHEGWSNPFYILISYSQ